MGAYYVHLDQFDGPLDLLLYLIEMTEVDIQDIFVSEITGQYLEYMKQIDTLDMDKASEFLAMSATLIYIKSRHMLPKPSEEPTQAEEDPEAAFIRQLHEYKLFKEASRKLQQLRESAKQVYTRLPEEWIPVEQEARLENIPYTALYRAFYKLVNRKGTTADAAAHIQQQQVYRDPYTVRGQLQSLRKKLTQKPEVTFEELFSRDASKSEIIVTFMALLEMISHGEILLKQSEPFASIRIFAQNLLTDDEAINYMDEIEETV